MDPQTVLMLWNAFKNSPELLGDFIVWLEATQVFMTKVRAATSTPATVTPAP